MKEELETSDASELPAVIGALLDTLDDKNETVRESVIESIRRITKENPDVVIHAAIYFWELHRKISSEHMGSLLIVMSEACKQRQLCLNADIASSIAELAINELIGDTEKEAAELLISLSTEHCTQAMGGLLTKLEPGILPHHTVVRTIGMIAANNPVGMLSFFKITLTIMLPMLTQTKDETLKQAFCFALEKISEAINDYVMNVENMCPEISKDTYKEEICSIFDILAFNWLKTFRDYKVPEAVLLSVRAMIPLLPEEDDGNRISRLMPQLLNLCKKPNTRLAATKALAVLLEYATDDDKETLRPFLEQIHQILSESISICPFNASHVAALTHYEVLQCSRSLVTLYPEEGIDRTLQQLKSPIAGHRARALVVLRHLINTLPQEDDSTLQKIAYSLQDSLGESNALQMVGAIIALIARPTVSLSESQKALFVRYIVARCGSKSNETQTHADALHLLATTVTGAESWLWPCLIRVFLDDTYSTSVVAILKALSPLTTKVVRDGNATLQRDFPGTKVLSRCLELLSEKENRLPIVTFLKLVAPLIGHQLAADWDQRLSDFTEFLQNETVNLPDRNLIWEEKVVDLLEESVRLEGEQWGSKLADELVLRASAPHVAPLLGSICNSNVHITLLVELAHSHGANDEFARAVGICSKRHLDTVLKLMEESCIMENSRKLPVRLLGLVKDAKAAATAEAAKMGLLKCYAEISRRANPQKLFIPIEKHILPWIIRQLNECKELTTKEAGLLALEQVAKTVHSERISEPVALRAKATALATLLTVLQSSSGYRPLQLYPAILRAAISLIRAPPMLTPEEREIFISTVFDKVISASTDIVLLLKPEIMQDAVEELGVLCSEVVLDSPDALAELVDVVLPWMQSKLNVERKTTLQVLRTTLSSYNDSIKYTYPGGKLEPGKLIGRALSWCADTECALRLLAVDCVALALNISTRHRSITLDNDWDNDLSHVKKIIVGQEPKTFYVFNGVKKLAASVSQRIPTGDIVSLAEGLIEGLLFRGEAGLAAGVALSQHFTIKGLEISRTDVALVESVISQMRQMENSSSRRGAAVAVRALMRHHPEDVTEHLLAQPLPLDRGTEECWKEIGAKEELATRVLGLLLTRLDNNNLFAENSASIQPGKNNTASFPCLAAIVALRHLLQTKSSEELVDKHISGLLSVLLKYLSGWLHVDAPVSVINTKFGYVPNREASRMNPFAEVYSTLATALTIVDVNRSSSLLNDNNFSTDIQTEENIVSVVRTMIGCISNRNDALSSLAQSLGKLMTSTLSAQRVVAATFYSELVGKVNCGVIWLDAIVTTLHEAKADSSPLIRKLATIGLARIAYLEPKQVDEYFDNCMQALLDGLEEPANDEGGSEVVIESLRGISILLSVQSKRPVSPRIVLALKPFMEKDKWEMCLAGINALGSVIRNWQGAVTLPDDDITDHLFGCLPCLIIRVEDANATVAKAAQETLRESANLMQCQELYQLICMHFPYEAEGNIKTFLSQITHCLRKKHSQRAIELRNAVVRGYSRSENPSTRATAATILGAFGAPKPEVVQRLLQLLRDKECIVRTRAAQALSHCFTEN